MAMGPIWMISAILIIRIHSTGKCKEQNEQEIPCVKAGENIVENTTCQWSAGYAIKN